MAAIRSGSSATARAPATSRATRRRGGGLPIDIADRDVDVPLSPLGEQQADALGDWFAAMPADERPQWCSARPIVRARQTAELVADARRRAGATCRSAVDERLREKEFGILDRLTAVGIEAQYPEQAELRRMLGKFYLRPPGGESWCDVILRLRSVLDMVSREYCGDRVLIVAHQVTVNCLRYLLERSTRRRCSRSTGAATSRTAASRRTSSTRRPAAAASSCLRLDNFVAPLREAGAPVTAEARRAGRGET